MGEREEEQGEIGGGGMVGMEDRQERGEMSGKRGRDEWQGRGSGRG